MANVKDPSKKRIPISATLDPEAMAYLDEKAPRFARGKSGGRGKALDQIILLVKSFEESGVIEELMKEAGNG